MLDGGHARGSLPGHNGEQLAPSAAGRSTALMAPVNPQPCPQPLTPSTNETCVEVERKSSVFLSNYIQVHICFITTLPYFTY